MAIPKNSAYVLQDDALQAPPLVTPNYPFLWAVSSAEWEVVQVGKEWKLLPQMRLIELKPGVNGVDCPRPNQPLTPDHFQRRLQKLKREGAVLLNPDAPIPTECLPKDVGPGGYRRILHGRNRSGDAAIHHHDAWTTFRRMPNGDLRPVFHRDLYNAWRIHLLTMEGAVPPIDPEILVNLHNEVKRSIARRLANTAMAPSVRDAELKPLKEQLKLLEDMGKGAA